MPNLWKWLMQANAKNAFALSILILLAAMGGGAWLFATAADDGTPDPVQKPAKQPLPDSGIPTSLPLIPFVNSQLNGEFVIPVNPFAPSLSSDNIEIILEGRNDQSNGGRARWPRLAVDNSDSSTTPRNSTTQADGPAPKAGEPPKPPVPSFKGYMKRPDGIPCALVLIHYPSGDKEDKSVTRIVGEKIEDFTLLAIHRDAITLRFPDGREETLRLSMDEKYRPEK